MCKRSIALVYYPSWYKRPASVSSFPLFAVLSSFIHILSNLILFPLPSSTVYLCSLCLFVLTPTIVCFFTHSISDSMYTISTLELQCEGKHMASGDHGIQLQSVCPKEMLMCCQAENILEEVVSTVELTKLHLDSMHHSPSWSQETLRPVELHQCNKLPPQQHS